MEVLAIIPARGGSKGVPGKNLRPFLGRPLVSRAVDAARAATSVTRIVVSTDDVRIGEAARAAGAEVVDRPEDISGDRATSESALLHTVETLDGRGYHPDLVVMLQCTSPLLMAEDIDRAVARLDQAHADSCFTASPFHFYVWDEDDDGGARGLNHSGRKRQRRQDIRPQYVENGAVYVMRTSAFVAEGDRFCGKTVLCPVDENRTVEIDSEADFVLARAMAANLGIRGSVPADIGAVVFDFDGVFTDNRVLVTDDGHEAVSCSRGDGMGLELLRDRGIPLWILSKERNPVVARRAEKLRLDHLQAVDDKPTALRAWASEQGVPLERVVYVGNDVNDVECMKLVGFSACPADSHESALDVADLVLTAPGGRGAVRELCDLVLATLDQKDG